MRSRWRTQRQRRSAGRSLSAPIRVVPEEKVDGSIDLPFLAVPEYPTLDPRVPVLVVSENVPPGWNICTEWTLRMSAPVWQFKVSVVLSRR